MAPAIDVIAVDLKMSKTESTMALSVYLLATAFAPLIIGPLSEVYGRKSIFHTTNIFFLAWNLTCGFANSKGLLISARLLAGFGASAVYSLAYGVLGDVWSAEQRGRSLSMYLLVPLTGSAVGPIIGGFIVQYSTWRWMFWSTTIFQVVLEMSSLLLFNESYAPVLLRRRAEKLRKDTGDTRYHSELERSESGRSTLWKISQPITPTPPPGLPPDYSDAGYPRRPKLWSAVFCTFQLLWALCLRVWQFRRHIQPALHCHCYRRNISLAALRAAHGLRLQENDSLQWWHPGARDAYPAAVTRCFLHTNWLLTLRLGRSIPSFLADLRYWRNPIGPWNAGFRHNPDRIRYGCVPRAHQLRIGCDTGTP